MYLLNTTLLKLLLFLILGIICGQIIDLKLTSLWLYVTFLMLALGLLYLLSKRKDSLTTSFGVFACVTIFLVGMLNVHIHNPINWTEHYTRTKDFKTGETMELHLRVTEILKSSIYQDKYFSKILTIDNSRTTGEILLNIDKDSLQSPLKIDDILITKTEIIPLSKPLNPHQFDYKAYLGRKYIYHQVKASRDDLLILSPRNLSLKGMAEQFRTTINSKLMGENFDDTQRAIINAILLGQKRDLSKELYQQYASAGVIHILAVSGLHVGIILLLLQSLLKPLTYLKRGRLIRTMIIVGILWCFAIIAGLSPSVVRAVTMFSIIAIGMNLKRQTNIYNTLAISMFILLLVRPLFLFDVGFQLSYLAVFAIVWIQPMLYKTWQPKSKIVDYFWKTLTVTLAAQIGVAPLSLFYFHQFPGLFFISNIVIIPFLGIILGMGIVVIILSLSNALPDILVILYGNVISSLNKFVAWVADQEAFLFEGISFGITSLTLTYVFLIFGIRLWQKYDHTRLVSILASILLIQGMTIYFKSQTSGSFTIFHKSRNTLLASRNNDELRISLSMDTMDIRQESTLKNYLIGEDINRYTVDTIRSVYRVNNELLLVVDSLPAYKVSFKPDMVLLRNSPKLNLERLIEHLEPKLIIADGSNYKSYVDLWEETCKNKKLPFHATAKKGALTITTLTE